MIHKNNFYITVKIKKKRLRTSAHQIITNDTQARSQSLNSKLILDSLNTQEYYDNFISLDIKFFLLKKIPEQLNYLNPEVGHLIEQHTRNEQLMVNPTAGIVPAIEYAYSINITEASNLFYY